MDSGLAARAAPRNDSLILLAEDDRLAIVAASGRIRSGHAGAKARRIAG
jgi:hypothetical protein